MTPRRWCIVLAVLVGDTIALMLPMGAPEWLVLAVLAGSWQLGCLIGAVVARTRRVTSWAVAAAPR